MVALSEPIRQDVFDGAETREAACQCVTEFAAHVRGQIQTVGRAPSVHVNGKLDDDMVSRHQSDGLRKRRAKQGEIAVRKPPASEFDLLIKHNALFAALLPVLTKSFDCFALVRNPVAVLASWQTVDLPVNRGYIPAGERYDTELRFTLANETDTLRRQVAIVNWFFASFGKNLDSEKIFRYEDLVDSDGMTLLRLVGGGLATPVTLENRNGNPLYGRGAVDTILAALVEAGGAWSEYYSLADCRLVCEWIRSNS